MKNIMLLMIISLLIPVSVKAQRSMFAGYDSFCGLPVIIESTSQNAVATIRNGKRVIIVDPSVMSNWKLSRIFALAHECGHHKLGHLSRNEVFSRRHMNATRRQELQADCWAAEALSKNGYYYDLKRTIVQQSSQGPIMQGPYPSGMERASYIAKCANINLNNRVSRNNTNFRPTRKSGLSASCVKTQTKRCMSSCQFKHGFSYNTCKYEMCNSPRQKRQNIKRCTK